MRLDKFLTECGLGSRREVKKLLDNGKIRVNDIIVKNPQINIKESIDKIEYDGNKLEYGDQIEGSFYLVTNGGEKEIPYSFRVQNSASGKTLDRLKKVSDFGDMAREDFDMAMRIFEYRDFTRVPFMQDLHIRAVYDSLIGHGDRYGQLEQFLIAMDQKEPVRLELEGSRSREYQALDGMVEDQVVIRQQY